MNQQNDLNGSMSYKEFIALARSQGFVQVKIGTYTGDAAATKAVSGIGFKPTAVMIIEQVTNKNLIIKTSSDGTKSFVQPNGGANLYVDDQIISLDSDGFTVGDGTGSANYTNEAQVYTYIACG